MFIIDNLADIRKLAANQSISEPLARHFERKLAAQQQALEPEQPFEAFSLATHGPLCVLEPGDSSLAAICMPDLSLVWPEWISRLRLAGDQTYIVLHVMADNDFIYQIYVPEAAMVDSIRTFLEAQSIEEELEGDDACDQYAQTEPF